MYLVFQYFSGAPGFGSYAEILPVGETREWCFLGKSEADVFFSYEGAYKDLKTAKGVALGLVHGQEDRVRLTGIVEE